MAKEREIDTTKYEEEEELRRGPWTLEEDNILINYISCNGEGRWNLLAKKSGLRRTGKSCRLRWLNYLKPDIKRGNLSPDEQFLIHELHSRWGNRWSRIAQYLPGRTDNEIKNYWRTRVQKQARLLNPTDVFHHNIVSSSSSYPNINSSMVINESPTFSQELYLESTMQYTSEEILRYDYGLGCMNGFMNGHTMDHIGYDHNESTSTISDLFGYCTNIEDGFVNDISF